MSAPFFTRRFYLDTVRTRGQGRGGEFFVGPFKSFWVSATNKSSFSAELVINTRNNSDRGLPLRLNQCQAFRAMGSKVDDACIEVPVAQPGVWVDITFSQDEELSVGSVAIDLSGEVSIYEGKAHSSARVDLPINAVTELIPALDTRAISTLQCKSGGVFWIGNDAELNNADWKNICKKVVLAIDEELEWKNKAALKAKTDVGASVFSLLTERLAV